MTNDRTDLSAVRLTSEIDALSQSLARAGVPLEQRAQLLESAALAAMAAVTLEAGRAEPRDEPAPVVPIAEAPSLRAVEAA